MSILTETFNIAYSDLNLNIKKDILSQITEKVDIQNICMFKSINESLNDSSIFLLEALNEVTFSDFSEGARNTLIDIIFNNVSYEDTKRVYENFIAENLVEFFNNNGLLSLDEAIINEVSKGYVLKKAMGSLFGRGREAGSDGTTPIGLTGIKKQERAQGRLEHAKDVIGGILDLKKRYQASTQKTPKVQQATPTQQSTPQVQKTTVKPTQVTSTNQQAQAIKDIKGASTRVNKSPVWTGYTAAVKKGQEGEEKLEKKRQAQTARQLKQQRKSFSTSLKKISQSDESKPSTTSTQATKAPKTLSNSNSTDQGVNLVAKAVAEGNKQEGKKKTSEAKTTKTKNKIIK